MALDEEDDMYVHTRTLRKKPSVTHTTQEGQVKVFVWGLNDKDQLAGLKGSKVSCLFLIICLQHCLQRQLDLVRCGKSSTFELGLSVSCLPFFSFLIFFCFHNSGQDPGVIRVLECPKSPASSRRL